MTGIFVRVCTCTHMCVNPKETETELEEKMLIGVLFALLLNPILGSDLVVVSRTEAMGRMSRKRREANLVPRHKIDIQAEIRSRYVTMKNVKCFVIFWVVGTGNSSKMWLSLFCLRRIFFSQGMHPHW